MSADILYEVRQGVALVTLNRPERRNALSLDALHVLGDSLASAASDPRVQALSIRAVGPSFCAGIDLKAIDVGDPDQASRTADGLAAAYRSLLTFPTPVLCAVGGAATGGGVGLAAAADLTWAGPRASFALPESGIGLVPALVSVVLRRRLAPKKLSGMALTGISLSAEQAYAVGLVDVLAESAVEADVDRFARDLLRDHSARAMRRVKAFLDRGSAAQLDAELAAAKVTFCEAAATEEARRGAAAFRQKEMVRWNEE